MGLSQGSRSGRITMVVVTGGVWHFIGDLPLGEENYIIPTWRDITASDMA